MTVTKAGAIPAGGKIPALAIGRRTRVLKWGCSLASPWAAQSFTVPDEGGNMRCLIGVWASARFDVIGSGAIRVDIDGNPVEYLRATSNFTGHKPLVPMFAAWDIGPGVHTLSFADYAGWPNVYGSVANNFLSYFILASPSPGGAAELAGPDRATFGEILSTEAPKRQHTDLLIPRMYASGVGAAAEKCQGPWSGPRDSRFTINNPVAQNALVILSATAYNNTQHVVAGLWGGLMDDAGYDLSFGHAQLGMNDPPIHRAWTPHIWAGNLLAGNWMARFVNGNYCASDTNDYGTGFAVLGLG